KARWIPHYGQRGLRLGGGGVRGGESGGHHDDAGASEGAGGGRDVDRGEWGDCRIVVNASVSGPSPDRSCQLHDRYTSSRRDFPLGHGRGTTPFFFGTE